MESAAPHVHFAQPATPTLIEPSKSFGKAALAPSVKCSGHDDLTDSVPDLGNSLCRFPIIRTVELGRRNDQCAEFRGRPIEIASFDFHCTIELHWQTGCFVPHGVYMTYRPHHIRLLWFALMAIGGMVSAVSRASACAANGRSTQSTGGCCVKPVSSCCCCEPASTSSRSGLIVRSRAFAAHGAGLSIPARPCECRSSEQPSSAPKPESRLERSRSDRDRVESTAPSYDAAPTATPFARLIIETTSPSKSPLYIRIARLLI
jgi:hypothetical protein